MSLARRDLYVDGAQSGSQTYDGLALYSAGTQYLTVQIQPPTSVTLGSGPDTIELNVSEDAYNSDGQTDAQFTISVDGLQIGGVQTADAGRAQGKTEAFLVQGAFGAGSHVVSVNFLNDAYGGSLALDRNLYVDSIIAGGQLYGGITLQSGGPQSETVQTPADVTLGFGPSALNFSLSEDALAGVDAQFTLSIGGIQIGGVQTVTASHAAGADQLFTILGNFPLNTYEPLTLNFLNGGGGRDLYVDKLTRVVPLGFYTSINSSPSELTASGPVSLAFGQSYPRGGPTTVGTGPDSVTINVSADQTLISQNPSSGVPFIVLVDGVQIGGDNYADVPHSVFATQAFTFQGNFGSGPHTVFVSPQTGTAPSAFFLDSLTYQGLTTRINTAVQETGQFITVQPPRAVLTGSMVTGPAEGSAILNGTPGADTIVAQGGDNTINGLGGDDTITGSAVGSDTINLVAASDTTATQDKVTLSGANNVVTASTASVAVSGSAINSKLNLWFGNNTVELDGPGNIVLLRTGVNTITATGGNAFVSIATGYPDSSNYTANITFSGTGNQVSAGGYYKPSGGGTLSVTGGTGNSTFFSAAGKTAIVTGGSANMFNIAGGTFDITTGSSSANVTITTGGNIYQGFEAVGTVRLSGSSNVVTAGYSNTTIVGGTGGGTFNLTSAGLSGGYNGSYTLTTGGTDNTVNLTAARQSTIDPGSGSDTVSITGPGSQSVIFRGSGDMLFLHPIAGPSPNQGGATATVSDQSTNLQVFIDPYLNSLTLTQFGAAGVLHLLSGAGDFTSAAAAAAAITPDAGGGTMLVLNQPYSPGPGNGLNPMGAIHFAAGEHITAANFSIG